ncbi:hypothetical protein U2A404250063 [Corynebacterium striatum]|nr:hypothetical protein U2A404250063 [Corynebacterium striatum]
MYCFPKLEDYTAYIRTTLIGAGVGLWTFPTRCPNEAPAPASLLGCRYHCCSSICRPHVGGLLYRLEVVRRN